MEDRGLSVPPSAYYSKLEESVLEKLRPRFEKLGYEFAVHPSASGLPDFMAGWIPDAVAMRTTDNVAIEVLSPTRVQDEWLHQLRKRFEGQIFWRLAIVVGGQEELSKEKIPTDDIASIREQQKELEQLLANGHNPAALVMGYALLEAALRLIGSSKEDRPMKPGTVVQALAMDGLLDPPEEQHLRSMIATRNKVIHGHLGIEVEVEQVQAVLAAIDKVLASRFAR